MGTFIVATRTTCFEKKVLGVQGLGTGHKIILWKFYKVFPVSG